MNPNQVRSVSKTLTTSPIGNISVQASRMKTGVFSFDVWLNPTKTDLVYSLGFDFDSRPSREEVYGQLMMTFKDELDSIPDEFRVVVMDFNKQLSRPGTKRRILQILGTVIKGVLYDYEQLGNVTIKATTCNYKVVIARNSSMTLTFGYGAGKKYVSVSFVIGVATFGFRDTTGYWSLDGLITEINRQLKLRKSEPKEKILKIVTDQLQTDKAAIGHLLFRFNNNLKIC